MNRTLTNTVQKTYLVQDCKILELPTTVGPVGHLVSINDNSIPFSIQRTYYLYDIKKGMSRGGHAHREIHSLIIAAHGAFDVQVRDGTKDVTFHLNAPNLSLYVPRLVWREVKNFSDGAVCLVFASKTYAESEIVRSWDEYVGLRGI